jgi:hypothetical protein
MRLRSRFVFRNVIRLGAIIGLVGSNGSFADAAIKLSTSWTVVQVEVSPMQVTHRTTDTAVMTLKNDGSIRAGEFDRQLGKEVENADPQSGDKYYITYRAREGTIFITTRWAGFTQVRRITTNQKDSCELTVTFTKIPGHAYYEGVRRSNREHMQMSDMHAEDLTCSRSDVPD